MHPTALQLYDSTGVHRCPQGGTIAYFAALDHAKYWIWSSIGIQYKGRRNISVITLTPSGPSKGGLKISSLTLWTWTGIFLQCNKMYNSAIESLPLQELSVVLQVPGRKDWSLQHWRVSSKCVDASPVFVIHGNAYWKLFIGFHSCNLINLDAIWRFIPLLLYLFQGMLSQWVCSSGDKILKLMLVMAAVTSIFTQFTLKKYHD